MIKNFLFLAFICVLVSCQKDSVQLNNNEFASSDKLTNLSDYEDFPLEVKEFIANGEDGHIGCAINDNRISKNGAGSLGTFAYPITPDLKPLFLLSSSLPCQPNIPYFLFSSVHKQGFIKYSNEYSATFYLVKNPNYTSNVRVYDINWDLNGQNDPVPVKSFTINDLQIGESNSVTCEVFSSDNKSTVYSQEMAFDFKISIDIGLGGTVIEYGSGYSYACTNTGLSPIIAP